MTGADAETVAVYDAHAVEYGAKFASDGSDARLENFLDRLPPHGRVLDLGCGMGRAAARMVERGFETVALDASSGMAAEAKRLYGLEVRIDTFDAVPDLGQFHGVWAHFSLLHAPASALPRHLSQIHGALHTGGVLVLGMKTGRGTARDRLGRRYAYVSEDGLCDALVIAGFVVEDVERGAGEGFDGVVSPWVVITAHA